ncbi:MAG: methyl-accepting chemotaxis protein [Gammaproteobacteria bacterium]|nr:methyl-accepting chemotaxis protein [Gammaproteobacteria bacterium]
MSTFFSFADKAIGRLSFAAKFALILVLFLIPVGYLGGLKLVEDRGLARALAAETVGIDYIAAIRDVYEKVPQHRGLSQAVLKGNEGARGKLDGVRSEVDTRFTRLLETDARIGAEFGQTADVRNLQRTWQDLQARNAGLAPPQSFAEHTALIGGLANLMDQVADRSGLTHDSDIATVHSARVLIEALPTVAEYLGRTRGLGSGIAAAGQYAPGLYAKLASNVAFVTYANDKLGGLLADLQHSVPQLAGQFAAQSQAAHTKIGEFLTLVNDKMLASEDAVSAKSDEVFAAGTAAISHVFALFDAVRPALTAHLEARAAHARADSWRVLGLAGGCLLLLLYFGTAFYRVMVRSVRRLSQTAGQIATGDLSVRVNLGVHDELQQCETAINDLAAQFATLISDVKRASDAVDHAIEQVGSVTTNARESMDQQQLQISQVATAINEMNATVQEVAQSASRTAEATRDARGKVEEGKRVVGASRSSIENLANEVVRAANVINEVETNSNEIGSVLDMIRSIAEQTNLLALNAAIEAARAGEQGRGFAVVADEVRTLAGRTQASTQEIQQMIERLQQGTRQAVAVMQEGQKQVGISVEESEHANQALDAITLAIGQISDMSSQIASAAEEQSAATEEINRSVAGIDQASHRTGEAAARAEQTSQALRQHAGELRTNTDRFRLS